MPSIGRINDPITHGGYVAEASEDVFANNRGVARVGDAVVCFIHGMQVIATGAETVLTNGRHTAHDGCLCSCGALVISDSNVYVEEGGA